MFHFIGQGEDKEESSLWVKDSGGKKNSGTKGLLFLFFQRTEYMVLMVRGHFLFFLIRNKKVSLKAHSAAL